MWEKAGELFRQLLSQGLVPDAITYSALISALERGGRWRQALLTFHQMTRSGCHPDGMVYNTLLEACWNSGVVPAQMRAAHIWSLANRSGHFRIYAQNKGGPNVLQHSCAVLTCGAAVVTLLRWLSDLKYVVS
jgi:pentatricopeptide repeat domain-containing protein 1